MYNNTTKMDTEYIILKRNIYIIVAIIFMLSITTVISALIAGGLYFKTRSLNNDLTELSLTTDEYKSSVSYYKRLSEEAFRDTDNAVSSAVNDFVYSLVESTITTDCHSLTKTKLIDYIAQSEALIENFESLGLKETHPDYYESLIKSYDEAVEALNNEDYLYPYSNKDYILLCNLVMREQGDNSSKDEAQCLVACVALNRKKYGKLYASDAKDPSNPTLLEVITQKGQYGPGYSYKMNLNGVTEKVQKNVRKALEHEFECPDNVLFQTGIYYPQKTMYTKIWNPAPYNNYTYFYYGKTE